MRNRYPRLYRLLHPDEWDPATVYAVIVLAPVAAVLLVLVAGWTLAGLRALGLL